MKLLLLLLLFALRSLPLSAQDILPSGMTSLMEDILTVFTGTFVKTILIICLCGCAVAYGFNKDNEKMKRNAIAIGIAVAILVCASLIIDAIWNASQG
ncbi:MAG: TrbC/VirB2 family protein [Spirochaetaceae bacterium]|jgi:type IV secretory pathway VirB2 component (pilin)|nr:TrbC/VirB2 family protein [Spirochaetaceae bacterium]